MKALLLEPVARPGLEMLRLQIPAVAPSQDPSKTVLDVVVDLSELLGGIPRAEVGAPASEHGVQVPDDHPDVLHPSPVGAGQISDLLADALHASGRWPPVQVVAAAAAPPQAAPNPGPEGGAAAVGSRPPLPPSVP